MINIKGSAHRIYIQKTPSLEWWYKIDERIRSELSTIIWEKWDKSRLKKEELLRKLEELKSEYSKVEEEIKELESKAV
jgi:predicted nuclease with TOPRIM domain